MHLEEFEGLEKLKKPGEKFLLEKTKADLLSFLVKANVDSDVSERAKSFLKELDELGLFCPEERKPIIKSFEAVESQNIQKVYEILQREVPKRDQMIQNLLASFELRIGGSKTVRTPLFIGPPGTGKSHLVEKLVEALQQVGFKVKFCRLVAINEDKYLRELHMNLLGTEAHYANAAPGALAQLVSKKKNQLVIVFLDEVDKGFPNILPLLIKFLDPSQPLQDDFLLSIFPHVDHDLRFKVFL